MERIRTTRGWIFLWVGVAAVYFVTGRLCTELSRFAASVTYVFYVPAGISLTASLLWGSKAWPGIFLGELAASLGWGQPVRTCFLLAFGNGLDAALAGWWLRDLLGRRIELDRLNDVTRLLIAETLVLQPIGAVIGITALKWGGTIPGAHFWWLASDWYSSNLLAQLVIAPVVLSWMRWRKPAENAREYWELAGLSLLAMVVAAGGNFRRDASDWSLPVSLFFVVPVLVWAAVRFVPPVPLTIGSLIAIFALFTEIARRNGMPDPARNLVIFRVNIFMTVSLGTALFLAAATGQQRRFEREQAQLIADLSGALNKVKRLEEMVTFCAWTGRIQWENRWISVEAFLRERYRVSITHGISEEAMAALLKELPNPKPVAGDRRDVPGA